MKRIIYHGSIEVIEKPIYHYEKSNKDLDYGPGFYCTEDLECAKEWANRRSTNGFVNKYSIDDSDLKVLNLTNKKYSVLHWIALLIFNRNHDELFFAEYEKELLFLKRYLIDVSQYDVVIGYRADDSYYAFPREFLNNNITIEKMESIYLNGELGTQYVLISKKAFDSICFEDFIEVENVYFDLYKKRISEANDYFYQTLKEERLSKGMRLRDLIND